jgi:DNA-binding NarL/FixJ family response regulator
VRFLIVEDEMLTALEVQDLLEDLGHEVLGVAGDAASARALAASGAELAIVDVNLRDGPTGREIASELARAGVSILFVTAHPGLISQAVEGAVGVLPKPLANEELEQAVRYAIALKAGFSPPPPPPARMRAFN